MKAPARRTESANPGCGAAYGLFRSQTLPCLVSCLVLGSTGCMVGPDPTPPTTVNPDSWHAELVEGVSRERVDPGAWWKRFDDPMLVELIADAERKNLDLRTAASRIREARSRYGIAAADLYPQISAGADADFVAGSQLSSDSFGSESTNFYSADLDFGWEIDLWGKVRRSMQAAEFDVLAEIENSRDLLITIRAEVARSYVEGRSLQDQMKSLQSIIESQAETLSLAKKQYQQGVVTEFSVLQAEAQLQVAEARLPALQYEFATAINRLSVLLAEPPGPLQDRFAATAEELGVPLPPATIAVGIPADVIRRRPDIRAAERTLGAAAAKIGVAEAALFPSLKLTGQGGYSSTEFDQLISPDKLGGLIGIQISWPVFTAGRLRSVVDVRNEQAYQALLSYESTVLNAIADVETALVAYGSSLREQSRLVDAVSAYDRAATLATDRLARGVSDLESLLNLERELLAVQQQLAVVNGQVASNAVGLYKALGGSWNIEENTLDVTAAAGTAEEAG
ncbi:MAG: efflux transporter outer membrane subunit [Planctomycetota bacterium]|nr:efflux transporter outer membrane subunit [Planctomycetota bacterium]